MSSESQSRGGLVTSVLLFIGFTGVAAWLATTLFLATNANVQGRSPEMMVWLVAHRALWASYFLVIGVPCLWSGVRRLKGCERKAGKILLSLIPALALVPACVILGVAVTIVLPFAGAVVEAGLGGPSVAESAVSPDGAYEAYVVEEPSIDPPNQTLYLETNDKLRCVYVAHLPEDVDMVRRIHWSPRSDLVVFETRLSLIAVRVPGYERIQLGTGREWRRAKPSRISTFSVGGPWLDVAAVEFPAAATFRYQLGGQTEWHTIDMGCLR